MLLLQYVHKSGAQDTGGDISKEQWDNMRETGSRQVIDFTCVGLRQIPAICVDKSDCNFVEAAQANSHKKTRYSAQGQV